MTTLHLRKSIGRSPFRRAFILIPLALACFGLAPTARAVSPAPDGGYANGTTAEGTNALFSLNSTAVNNTAVGETALYHDTSGFNNTAIGNTALFTNSNRTEEHSHGA